MHHDQHIQQLQQFIILENKHLQAIVIIER